MMTPFVWGQNERQGLAPVASWARSEEKVVEHIFSGELSMHMVDGWQGCSSRYI